jgi:hemerythrin-like domain-containing protein
MYNIIESLHTDHINFSRLLSLLEQQAALLNEGGLPDFEVMLDTIDYLQNYADLYHHPREDLIFRFFLERSDVAREAIEELRRQHRMLWDSTNRLRLAIDGILHGEIVPRSDFTDQLGTYLIEQREHLNEEEGYILPLLKQAFSSADWEELNRSLPFRSDPLFGPSVEQQYRALYTRITSEPIPIQRRSSRPSL